MKAWTIREAKFIRENVGSMTIGEIAKKLGRTKIATKEYMIRNGIRTGRDGRFKVGNDPKHKWVPPVASRFKPGYIPKNAKPDGTVIVKDNNGKPYKHVRINAKWYLLHRVNWVEVNGPIPEGHILSCIDGNTLNAVASNWTPITRAEQARRNSNREKASKTMREHWQRVYKLESVGLSPNNIKLKTKRKPKAVPKVAAQVDAEQLKIAGGYFNRY